MTSMTIALVWFESNRAYHCISNGPKYVTASYPLIQVPAPWAYWQTKNRPQGGFFFLRKPKSPH